MEKRTKAMYSYTTCSKLYPNTFTHHESSYLASTFPSPVDLHKTTMNALETGNVKLRSILLLD